MECKICKHKAEELFQTLVLQKYQVKYYQCPKCEFIQTEEPYWLKEAYESVITNLDIGLVGRNIHYSGKIADLIERNFNPNARFLDYGGGYGMFVRLMRDLGFDYYRYDIYCENLFAKHFDYSDLAEGQQFEVLTAFEVFEHLVDPIEEIKKMLSFSDNIVFSTELQPSAKVTPETWWYFVPETGQHIALYSKKSLQYIADYFQLFQQSHGNLHMLTVNKNAKLNEVVNPTFQLRLKRKFNSLWEEKEEKRKSLLQHDFNYIKSKAKK